MREFISFAEALADASRALLIEAARRSYTGEKKSDDSPVTDIDKAVEARLREMIADAYTTGPRASTCATMPTFVRPGWHGTAIPPQRLAVSTTIWQECPILLKSKASCMSSFTPKTSTWP